MKQKIKLSPGRLIALGFAGVILIGALLLCLPFAVFEGKQLGFLEALFTSTSAVCVTGLIVVDTGTTFTVFGRTVIAALIQVGGLGIAILGVAVTLALRRGISFKDRSLIKESWNIDSYGGLSKLLRTVLLMTVGIELLGAVMSLPIFLRTYPLGKAVGYSLFHAVSSFNNAGFDLFGGFQSLTAYNTDWAMNLVTAFLIITGGIGYLVIIELFTRRRFKKFTLQSKVVLVTTALLLALGTVLFKITDGYTWLEAFFQSVTARTAGFNTVDLGAMSQAGLFVMVALMIVGASPGSTGGGTKTTTLFALFMAAKSATLNTAPEAFKRKLPESVMRRAFIIVLLSLSVLSCSTLLICIFEPQYSFMQILFEVASALNTVGVTTGITPQFGAAARIVLILTMYIGRLGPLTIATLWVSKPEKAFSYSEESITVG